jgi:hypothetical protein
MILPKKFKGFKVTKKHAELKDYAGMNYYAAKALGLSHGPKKKEIWVDDKLPRSVVKKNIVHEVVEAKIMRRGKKYWCAHCLALHAEGKHGNL